MEKITSLTEYKNIGVFLSGGLDSALLAALALELLPDSKFVFITGIHKHLDYYNESYARQVTAWLKERYPNGRIMSHTVYKYESREDAQARKKTNNQKIVKLFKLNALLTGMTLNPVNEPTLMVEGRDKTRDTPVRYEHDYLGIKHFMPFHTLDKKQIYDLYQQYNLDELAQLTISCESEKPPRPCGECWWCNEKHWAFNYY